MKGEKAAPNILQEIEGHSYPKYIVAAFASLFPAETRRQREPTVLFATWTSSISGLCRGVDRLLSPTGAAGRPGVLLLARRKNFHPSPHHHREFTHQQGNEQRAVVIVHDCLPSPMRYHHHASSSPPRKRHVTIIPRFHEKQVTADDDGTQAAVETPEARPSLRLAWFEDSQPASKPQQRLIRLWLVTIPAPSQPIFSLPLWGRRNPLWPPGCPPSRTSPLLQWETRVPSATDKSVKEARRLTCQPQPCPSFSRPCNSLSGATTHILSCPPSLFSQGLPLSPSFFFVSPLSHRAGARYTRGRHRPGPTTTTTTAHRRRE